MIHNRLKFTSLLLLVSSWLRGRVLNWRLSQPGFDPSYGKLVCLATLMSSDRMKQICLWMTIYIYYQPISIMIRVFANGLGDQCSILALVKPKTQKLILDASLLYTQHYKVWIKAKWSNLRKLVACSPTLQCSSYWKGSLWVTLGYSWSTYLLTYIIYTYLPSLAHNNKKPEARGTNWRSTSWIII